MAGAKLATALDDLSCLLPKAPKNTNKSFLLFNEKVNNLPWKKICAQALQLDQKKSNLQAYTFNHF
ncbi:hypothetical protein [Piscirickettsia litoralis]|uniref:hypothetical protein n=1 Tax=Piscirickettsia litoralis TaxID=1891921 RepID=UPI001112CC5C|nr:hypothetical protein [Piscirickettsia litoralis]